MFEAKILKDSICNGNRLTTMQLTHPRIIHAEFNTHCMFARNASSSRAIPFNKVLQRVKEDPFIPEHFGINQSGMQAFSELSGVKKEKAVALWLKARDNAINIALELSMKDCPYCKNMGFVEYNSIERYNTEICSYCNGEGLGLNIHKQIVNRLLEPWSWITVCVTGDSAAWLNYFSLRCHPDAQPDIQKQAYMAQKLYFESVPELLNKGQWHLPYIKPEEKEEIYNFISEKDLSISIEDLSVQISTGRCARTSYLIQEGIRDFSEDIKLHDRLRYHVPLHASPFEHVCQAMGNDNYYAKYKGWKSYRHMLPNEYVKDFKPNYLEKTL